MVLPFYCKQRVVQLYFEWNISYGRIAKDLMGTRQQAQHELPKSASRLPSQQPCLPSGASHIPSTFSPGMITKWQAAARQCSKAYQKCLQVNNIPLFKTPPESLDCNPIENLWHKLKHYIRTTTKQCNKEQLIQGIQFSWATVTPEKCCWHIDHLKKVIS